MALSRDKKQTIVNEVSQLLGTSKLTVIAAYQGTSVKAMQDLRRQARDDHTVVRVVKNRLVQQALKGSEKFKHLETEVLKGQLLYAFNSEDEVAPAQTLANFAKTQPTIEFVGAISSDGALMSAEEVRTLASLPSKQQLQAMLASTLAAPLSGLVNVMAGNLRGLLNSLNARAEQLEANT